MVFTSGRGGGCSFLVLAAPAATESASAGITYTPSDRFVGFVNLGPLLWIDCVGLNVVVLTELGTVSLVWCHVDWVWWSCKISGSSLAMCSSVSVSGGAKG